MTLFKGKWGILLLVCITATSFQNRPGDTARITYIIGQVEWLASQQSSWSRARLNQQVGQGDRIRTTLNARVELEMPDGSVIKINENSVFDVKEIKTAAEADEDKMSFTLWAGDIWASFKKIVSTRQSREVESPGAVVAIRGTTLEMNVNNDQTTRVRVIEGRVIVRSRDVSGQVELRSNQQSLVERGKAPTPANAFTPGGEAEENQAGAFEFRIDAATFQFRDPAVLSGGVPVNGTVASGASVKANGVPLNVAANGTFSGRIAVKEGLNEIRLTARLDGSEILKQMRVFVNTKKPEIRLSKPLVTGYMNRRDYSLSGAVFDPTPLDKVRVFLNGEMVTELQGRGSFNRTIILKEGKNNIRIAAVDRSDNRSELTEQIFLDTVKPIITITEPGQPVFMRFEPPPPPSGEFSHSSERLTQQIRGMIIDPDPSSGIKRVSINGKEIRPNSDGSFQTEIVVKRGSNGQPGENRLAIVAEDLAGNITRDNTRVIMVR